MPRACARHVHARPAASGVDPNEIRQLAARPGVLPLGVGPGVAHPKRGGFVEREFAAQMRDQMRHAMGAHHRQSGIEAARGETRDLVQRALRQHRSEPLRNALLERLAFGREEQPPPFPWRQRGRRPAVLEGEQRLARSPRTPPAPAAPAAGRWGAGAARRRGRARRASRAVPASRAPPPPRARSRAPRPARRECPTGPESARGNKAPCRPRTPAGRDGSPKSRAPARDSGRPRNSPPRRSRRTGDAVACASSSRLGRAVSTRRSR